MPGFLELLSIFTRRVDGGQLTGDEKMNEIEAYLHENPELIERFMNDNEALLNELKDRFAGFLESGDLIGRYLLSKALFEILRVTGEASKELLKTEMSQRGLNITDAKGSC